MSDTRKNAGENKKELKNDSGSMKNQPVILSKMIGPLEEAALSAFPLQQFKLDLPPGTVLVATRLIPEEKSMLGICCSQSNILTSFDSRCVSTIRKWDLESKQFKDIATHRHDSREMPVACLLGDQRYILAEPFGGWFTSSDLKKRWIADGLKALHAIDNEWLIAQSKNGDVAIWDVNSTHPRPLFSKNQAELLAELKKDFTGYVTPYGSLTLHALSNKRFAMSDLLFQTVIWDFTSLVKPITHRLLGKFLCETNNTIVSVYRNLDSSSETRELLQFDKMSYRLMHRCQIAQMPDFIVTLPNDCFMIGYRVYEKNDYGLYYFNNRLELFAQANLKGDIRSTSLHSIYEEQRELYPLLIQYNGTVLGDPLKCCLEPGVMNSLPNPSEVETAVTDTFKGPKPLARLIVEYAGMEPHPIAKERFVGFFNHLIGFLGDAKEFSKLNAKPWFASLFERRTAMESLIEALNLKQLDQPLSNYELEVIENNIVNQLNIFISQLPEGDKKKILDYLHHDALLAERRVGIPLPLSLLTLEAIISFKENKLAARPEAK